MMLSKAFSPLHFQRKNLNLHFNLFIKNARKNTRFTQNGTGI